MVRTLWSEEYVCFNNLVQIVGVDDPFAPDILDQTLEWIGHLLLISGPFHSEHQDQTLE